MNCVIRDSYLERARGDEKLVGLAVDNVDYQFVKADNDEFYVATDIVAAINDGEVHLLGNPVCIGGLVTDKATFVSLIECELVTPVTLRYGPGSLLYPILTTIWTTAEILPSLARDIMPLISHYIVLVALQLKEDDETRDRSATYWSRLAINQVSFNPTLPTILEAIHIEEIEQDEESELRRWAIDTRINMWREGEIERLVPLVKASLVAHDCLYVCYLPSYALLELYSTVVNDVALC